jgi:uncharacterized DUF497 family protein
VSGFYRDSSRSFDRLSSSYPNFRADRIDSKTDEQRWHAIGVAQIERGARPVPLVVHVYREDHRGEEIIRIISARAADRRYAGLPSARQQAMKLASISKTCRV